MSCCAPCSVAAIQSLIKSGQDFIVLFNNPNIFPLAEYQQRLDEQIKLCKEIGAKYHVLDYDHDNWKRRVAGLESEPERGARCTACFQMRIEQGTKWARENGYDEITTVFGLSPHKSQAQVDLAAKSVMAVKYMSVGFEYNPPNNMHRQNYCGCEFSETYKNET